MDMIDKYPGATKPILFVKHIYDVLQLFVVGYMYWEPGMVMHYDYSTEEEPNEKVISEFKTILYEQEREKEAFEFHIEDYLDEEPIKTEIILLSELITEMKKEFHPIISQPDNPINEYYQSCQAYLKLLEEIFSPHEILALFRHSYFFYHTKDWDNLIPKVITDLKSADLKSYYIKNLYAFIEKINSIPDYLHFGIIDILCNSDSVYYCHEFYIDSKKDGYNIGVEDLRHEQNNREWENFNKQLEKFASPNPK